MEKQSLALVGNCFFTQGKAGLDEFLHNNKTKKSSSENAVTALHALQMWLRVVNAYECQCKRLKQKGVVLTVLSVTLRFSTEPRQGITTRSPSRMKTTSYSFSEGTNGTLESETRQSEDSQYALSIN